MALSGNLCHKRSMYIGTGSQHSTGYSQIQDQGSG